LSAGFKTTIRRVEGTITEPASNIIHEKVIKSGSLSLTFCGVKIKDSYVIDRTNF